MSVSTSAVLMLKRRMRAATGTRTSRITKLIDNDDDYKIITMMIVIIIVIMMIVFMQ